MIIHTRHWLRLLLVCACVAGLSPRAHAQIIEPFVGVVPGGVTFTGNTLGLSGGQQGQPGTNHSVGVFVSRNQAAPGEVVGTTLDWRDNGSGAMLKMPAGATVRHAELIWGGTVRVHENDLRGFINEPVSLTLPSGRTVTVAPRGPARTYDNAIGTETFFAQSADVTNLITPYGSGQYIVGGVPAVLDIRSSDVAVGWTLAVVYTAPGQPLRHVRLFAGLDSVPLSNGSRSSRFSFALSCLAAAPNAKLFVSAMEGDANPRGEMFQIGVDTAPGDPLTNISGPRNPELNFFGSQINGDDGQTDTTGWFGDRNHDPFPIPPRQVFAGRQGWDITAVDLNPWVGPTAKTVAFEAFSDGYDAFALLAMALQYDVDGPQLGIALEADSLAPTPNQVVRYTARLTNPSASIYAAPEFWANKTDKLAWRHGFVWVNGVRRPADSPDYLALPALAPGATHVIEFEATVTAAGSAADPVAVWTRAAYAFDDCAASIRTVSRMSNVVRATYGPALDVTAGIVPFGIRTGDVVTVEFTIRNVGGAVAPDVTVRAPLPAGVTYVPGTTQLDGVPVDDIESVMPFVNETALAGGVGLAGERRIAYRVRVERGTAAVTASIVTDIDGAGAEPAETVTATTPVDNREPPLHVHVFGPQIVTPGDVFTFTGQVYNQTLDPVAGLTMDFDLPAGVTFVPGTCAALPCAIPALAPGAQYDLRAEFRVANPFTGASLNATARVRDAEGKVLALGRATITILGRSRYFAEGAANAFFSTKFSVVNPTLERQTVKFRFLREDGSVLTFAFELGAQGRRDVDPFLVFGHELGAFSTVVESSDTIAVDRLMTWDGTGYGSSADNGVAAPSDTWFFAEGATGIFQLFYLLENPDPVQTSQVTVRYLTPGREPLSEDYTVGPNTRLTIPVHEIEGLQQAEVSAVVTVTNGVRIVADRAMYKSGPGGQPLGAGHASSGSADPSTSWYFGEGATGDFWDTFLLLANPGTVETTATVRFQLPNGESFTKDYPVPANRRVTVVVEGEDDRLAATPVAMTVTSERPLVAERAMWWPGPHVGEAWWSEAHAALGATSTASRWAVASGVNGGDNGDSTYLLVSNASDDAGEVNLTVVLDTQTVVTKTLPVVGRQRLTVDTATELPETVGHSFSLIVEGVSPLGGLPLVVERSHYASPNGQFWAAGDVTLATPVIPPPPPSVR